MTWNKFNFLPGVWGVKPAGVAKPPGVVSEGVNWAPGVSSQRDLLLLADGVGVSSINSPVVPVRSVRGVSAQPELCPGVSI